MRRLLFNLMWVADDLQQPWETDMHTGYGRTMVACFIGTALYPMCAAAADESAPQAAGLEEVVVTADKRQEREMDVPISMTAVSTDALAAQDLVQLKDYYSRIPGLQYQGDRTQDLSLRGLTTGDSTNPTIAILVDDVQFGS
jgi:iron complex outermembrane receptor protein